MHVFLTLDADNACVTARQPNQIVRDDIAVRSVISAGKV